MEAVGGAASPEDAISFVAELINRLDPISDSYEADTEGWGVHLGHGQATDVKGPVGDCKGLHPVQTAPG